MASRWSTVAILLFWLSSMGWLLEQKILPSWVVGEPPTMRTILQDSTDAPVGWKITFNGQSLGWAVTQSLANEQGGHDVRSRVRLARLPLATMTPSWLASFLKMLERTGELPELSLDLDALTTIGVDALGRPLDFRSAAQVGYGGRTGGSFAPAMQINMRGTIDGNQMKLAVRAGEFVYRTRVFLPTDALLGDALSPQARLPELHVGQTWTEPGYSPFRSPNSPMETLHATVERRETIVWNDERRPTLVVVLRADPGSGLSNVQTLRGKSWVDTDGRVLRQESLLGSSRLVFERVSKRPPKVHPTIDSPLLPWWKTTVRPLSAVPVSREDGG